MPSNEQHGPPYVPSGSEYYTSNSVKHRYANLLGLFMMFHKMRHIQLAAAAQATAAAGGRTHHIKRSSTSFAHHITLTRGTRTQWHTHTHVHTPYYIMNDKLVMVVEPGRRRCGFSSGMHVHSTRNCLCVCIIRM